MAVFMTAMNLIEELQLLEQELKGKFSLSFLESLARETGMIQHARKYKAQARFLIFREPKSTLFLSYCSIL